MAAPLRKTPQPYGPYRSRQWTQQYRQRPQCVVCRAPEVQRCSQHQLWLCPVHWSQHARLTHQTGGGVTRPGGP